MTIQFYKRFAYGRDDSFPTGEHADAVCTLTGKKTLSKDHMEALEALGHTLQEVLPPTK